MDTIAIIIVQCMSSLCGIVVLCYNSVVLCCVVLCCISMASYVIEYNDI